MLSHKNHRAPIWILTILLLTNGFIICIASAEDTGDGFEENEQNIFDSITTTVQIDSGDMFYIYFDAENLELTAKPPVDLPDECDQALAIVPEWLRGNLSYKFRQLSEDFQITYANLILNSPDEKYIDEIAFCVAHSAVENLQDDYFFPELLTHNAQLIYDADQYLNYVDIVERVGERGPYTTVIYNDKDNISVELAKDIYYWYIVEPKLSDELATYVDPDHDFTSEPPINEKNYGVPPPDGKFWRDWLFYYRDEGYPLLKDYLGEAWTVWEAISKCNSWMSGSMSFTSDEERPIQPVRIYRKHIGRCGEYQDMRNAIARAGLIPSTCALNTAEDHVWNEFWDQRWIHWDGTVDNPMMYENGWGKKISSVWNTRGDAHIWSVTKKYTQTCNYTATVLDDSGMPVDGALVRVLTEHYYYPDDLLSLTTWGITDYTGTVTIPLGDERNFWSSAESDELGSDPLNGNTQVITNSEAGANYTYTFNLPMSASVLKASDIPPPAVEDEKFRMEVSYEVVANIVKVENSYTGEEGDLFGPSGNVDFFIADSLNYNLYNSGMSFNAYNVSERSSEGNIPFVLPDENSYYAVFSNEFAQDSAMIVNITIDIVSGVKVEITAPEDGSEFNDGEMIFITGTAWGPEGVTTVEIDVDESGIWAPATDTSDPGEEPYSTWQFNLDTTDIKPGILTLLARASHAENSAIMLVNIVLNDVTDPELEVESPVDNSQHWLGQILTVNGTVMDNGWIQTLELIIDNDEPNCTDITSLLVDGFYSYEISVNELDFGEHTITVKATDTSSNSISVTKNIKVLETTKPEVRIHSPSDNRVFKLGDSVDISGYASDNMGIQSLEIIINGKTSIDILSRLEEDGSWDYEWDTQTISSFDGLHTVEAKAIDNCSNFAADDVKIILDGTAPEASIDEPDYGQIFKAGNTIAIQGTAFDEWGIDEGHLLFDNNVQVDITWKIRDGNWQYNWDTFGLKSGEHIITVSVTDSVGHESEASVTVTIDAEEPEVGITEVEDTVTVGDLVILSGTASDDIEIAEIILVIDYIERINITQTLANGNWKYTWDTTGIVEGRHTISVIVTDGAGNEVSEDIRIYLVQGATSPDGFYDGSLDDFGATKKDSTIDSTVLAVLILIIILIVVLIVIGLLYVSAGKKKQGYP